MFSKPTGIAAMFSTNRNLEITNLFALVAGGILIKIIFYSQGPANATIWGYTLSAIAVFLLTIIAIAFTTNEDKPKQQIEIIIKFAIPSVLFLLLLIWSIGQAVSFFNKINSNILPEEYNLYSFVSSFLIIVQGINLYMFFNEEYSIQNKGNKTETERGRAKIENMDNSTIMYILTIVNSIILGMMQIVLTFFTTDG